MPLERLDTDLWVRRRPLRLWVGDVGSRMTVLRLPSGDLILHSPVEIDDETRDELNALGTVRWIVGPNAVHHFFLADWFAAYPNAALCAPTALAKKRRDLPFSVSLPESVPAPWAPEVRVLLFGGAPLLGELVFLHAPSRTLVLTDLAFHRPPGAPDGAPVFHWLVGARNRFGPHRIARSFFRDRSAAARSRDEILEWDFDRVIVSHGEVLETDGRDAFERAFAFLR